MYEGGALQLGVLSSWTLGIGAVGSNLDAAVIDAAITELDDWPETLRTGSDGALPRISPDWKRWFDPDDAELWDPLDAGRLAARRPPDAEDRRAAGRLPPRRLA